MSKIVNEREYSFSECISKANYFMSEAFYWSKSSIYAKSVKEYAQNAEAWFQLAKVAQKQGVIVVAIPAKGIPFQPIRYSYAY